MVFFCNICRECHEYHESHKYNEYNEYHFYLKKSTRCTEVFNFNFLFIKELNYVLSKDENSHLNVLKIIKDKFFGYGLFGLIGLEISDYDNKSKEEKDSINNKISKIVYMEKQLPILANKFIEIIRPYMNSEVLKNFEDKISTYNGKSIEYLKGNEEFLNILDESLGYLGVIKEQEGDNLSSPKKDIELFKKFFEKVKHRLKYKNI